MIRAQLRSRTGKSRRRPDAVSDLVSRLSELSLELVDPTAARLRPKVSTPSKAAST
ncbi:MAG: hypothetical protein ACYDEY_04145 [Acidimicrobiales bacterium]